MAVSPLAFELGSVDMIPHSDVGYATEIVSGAQAIALSARIMRRQGRKNAEPDCYYLASDKNDAGKS